MQARGFTLIEMLTVVTISAILVAMAVPSFAWINARTRAANTSNSLLASFELARSEAIRRNMQSQCLSGRGSQHLPSLYAAQPRLTGLPVMTGEQDGLFLQRRAALTAANFEGPGDTVLRVEQFVLPARTRSLVQSSAAPQFYSFRGDGMSLGSGASDRHHVRSRLQRSGSSGSHRCRPLYRIQHDRPREFVCTQRWPTTCDGLPMKPSFLSVSQRRRVNGASMLEVLVSLVIVAFGLLGLLGLQARALTFQKDSFDGRAAAELANQISDRIKGNMLGFRDRALRG